MLFNYLMRQLEFCFLWNISTCLFFFGGGCPTYYMVILCFRGYLWLGNLAAVILTTWSFWHNCTLRQLSWYWARCGFLISEAQYRCSPPVSAGIWQYNHFPIYSLCNVMRCTALGPHHAELRLNSTANVPLKPELLYTLDACLGGRNWNPWGCSIPFSQHIGAHAGKASPSLESSPRTSTDFQHRALLALGHLLQPSCCPAGATRKSGGRYRGSPQLGTTSAVSNNHLVCLCFTFCDLTQTSPCSLSHYFGLSVNLERQPLRG